MVSSAVKKLTKVVFDSEAFTGHLFHKQKAKLSLKAV